MPIDDVRVAVVDADEPEAAVTILDDRNRLNDEFTVPDGTEITLLVRGAEFDIRYVGDKDGDAMASPIQEGYLGAALAAGAHAEFIVFVREYPESEVAETLQTAISMDALDRFTNFAGSFESALWEHGVAKAGNPDKENAERIRNLFPQDRWPTWMRQRAEDGEENGGENE